MERGSKTVTQQSTEPKTVAHLNEDPKRSLDGTRIQNGRSMERESKLSLDRTRIRNDHLMKLSWREFAVAHLMENFDRCRCSHVDEKQYICSITQEMFRGDDVRLDGEVLTAVMRFCPLERH